MAISNSKPSKPLNYQRVTLHKITPPIGTGSWMFEMCHMSTRAIQKVRPGRSLRDVHSAWGLKTIVADLIHGLWRMRSRKDPGSVSSSRESLGFTVVRTSRVRRSFDFWKCLGIWYLDISGLLYKNSPTSNHQKIIRFFLVVFFGDLTVRSLQKLPRTILYFTNCKLGKPNSSSAFSPCDAKNFTVVSFRNPSHLMLRQMNAFLCRLLKAKDV